MNTIMAQRIPRPVLVAVAIGATVVTVLAGLRIMAPTGTADWTAASPSVAGAPAVDAATSAIADATTTGALDARQNVRDVTPPGVTRVYMTAAATATAKGKPTTSMQIEQAGVKPSGLITWDGGNLQLHGVAFPDARRICVSASGERWPCGRRAFIALHNKIATQTLHCEPRAASDPPTATCFIGDTNLSLWLLSEGFGRVAPDVSDKELIAAEAAAKKAKAGIWADAQEAPAETTARKQ